jgi:hypothetical protein
MDKYCLLPIIDKMEPETAANTGKKPGFLGYFKKVKIFPPHKPAELYDIKNNTRPDISYYLQKKFKPQLDWYENNALLNRRRLYFCQIVITFTSAIIPIINILGILGEFWLRLWSSILGGAITVLTASLQLTKAHENWVLYRSTAESLKTEYHLFSLTVGDYAQATNCNDRNQLFIKRVQLTITTEGNKFLTTQQQKI